jgi:hypothetical protein
MLKSNEENVVVFQRFVDEGQLLYNFGAEVASADFSVVTLSIIIIIVITIMTIITNVLEFKSVYMQRIAFKNVVGLTFSSTSIFYRSYTRFCVI